MGPVFVYIDEGRSVRYGRSEDAIDQVSPPTDSPADTLLFALAACIAISLHMAAEKVWNDARAIQSSGIL